MEVTFALTPDDLWTFNLYVLRRTPAFKLRSGINFALVPLCLTVFFAASGFGTWQCLLFGVVSAAVWVPFLLWFARWQAARTARKRRAILDKQTVSLSAKGVRQVTTQADSLVWWTGLLEVSESATQIMFFTDANRAFVVPKHAFSSQAEAQAFLDKARRYRDAALNGQTLPDDSPAENSGVWPPPPQSASQR